MAQQELSVLHQKLSEAAPHNGQPLLSCTWNRSVLGRPARMDGLRQGAGPKGEGCRAQKSRDVPAPARKPLKGEEGGNAGRAPFPVGRFSLPCLMSYFLFLRKGLQ